MNKFSVYLVPSQLKLSDRVDQIEKDIPVDISIFDHNKPEIMAGAMYLQDFENEEVPFDKLHIESPLSAEEIEAFFQTYKSTANQYTKNRNGIYECVIGVSRNNAYESIKAIPDVKIIKDDGLSYKK